MAKQNIKEYGADLLKQLRDLEKQQRSLRNKVIKRFKFMLDQHPDDPYLTGFTKEGTSEYSTDMMIFVIIRLEAIYVSKTRQTEMFDNTITGYDEEGHPLNANGQIVEL